MADFEWALESKPQASYNDYEILDCSTTGLDRNVFTQMCARFAAGAAELPQVTVAFARARNEDGTRPYLVIAFQDWSARTDGTGRRIAETRWFYLPYQQFRDHPVSYEALYTRLGGVGLPPASPVADLPILDAQTSAARLTAWPWATGVAALLLTGRPVCVVGAGGASMPERLAFVDTVAALLPYGMRTRFTASTWSGSMAEHKLRLTFAAHAPSGAYAVTWGQPPEVPRKEQIAWHYAALLGKANDPAALVARLARLTEPLSFGDGDPRLAANLLEEALTPAGIEPPTRSHRKTPAIEAAPRPAAPPAALPHTVPPHTVPPPAARRAARPELRPMEALVRQIEDARTAGEIEDATKEMEAWGQLRGRSGDRSTRDRAAQMQRTLRTNLIRTNCFHDILKGAADEAWAADRYEQLTRAAFADDMGDPQVVDEACRLSAKRSTPSIVWLTLMELTAQTMDEDVAAKWMRARRRRLGPLGWFRGDTLGTLAMVVLATVAGLCVGLLVGGDSPENERPPAAAPGAAMSVEVPQSADAAGRFVASVYARVLERLGYEVDTMSEEGPLTSSDAPVVVVGYDTDLVARQSGAEPDPTGPDGVRAALTGQLARDTKFFPLAARLPVTARDVLIVKKGRDLATLRGSGTSARVRDTYGTAQSRALRDYLGAEPDRTLAADLREAVRAGKHSVAVVPDNWTIPDSYERVALPEVPLTERTLIALANSAVEAKAIRELERVTGLLRAEDMPPGESGAEQVRADARAFVEAHAEAAPDGAAAPERSGFPFLPVLGGSVALLLLGVVLVQGMRPKMFYRN